MMQLSPSRAHELELRAASAGMVAIAAAWPLLPVHPEVACPLRALTGIPCPLCGMTRAIIAAAHGHAGQSLAFNPGGVILLLLAVVAIVRPAWLARLQLPAWSLLAIIGALWAWNIGFNPTFHQLLLR
jgi:hypothetical protein